MAYREFWLAALLISATTVGAGVFVLPYLTVTAGWGGVLGHLVLWAVVVAVIQVAYWDVLVRLGEHHRLAGLAARHLSRHAYRFALLAVLGGLLLALLAFLVLAAGFVHVLLPGAPFLWIVLGFWVVGSLPLFLRLRTLSTLETVGTLLMVGIIVVAFAFADHGRSFAAAPFLRWEHLLLPFGGVIFSLAGWTAIEPLYDILRRRGGAHHRARLGIALGVVAAIPLYVLFIVGVLGSTTTITGDALTGLAHDAPAIASALAVFGLFALWTTYVPVALAAFNALHLDAKISRSASNAIVLFVPVGLVLLGFKNFLSIVSVVGGVFAGAQYALIALLALRVLQPTGIRRMVLVVSLAAFSLAALYELWYFVIH